MQPLISPVDHETRRSSFQRAEDSRPSENTPLIHRFPSNQTRERHLPTIIIVGFLLGILLSGLVIGIYLLVLQSDSENILPPVEDTITLFAGSRTKESESLRLSTEEDIVFIQQTDTRQCDNLTDCAELLRNVMVDSGTLPYSFLVSPRGLIFEALGWKRSPLILAFIGNFTDTTPPGLQVEAAKKFMTSAVNQHRLSPEFAAIGRNSTYYPKKLFDALSALPQWTQASAN
ncbi:unnamed protein product [Leptosia nina]|uniref:Peptidoglycan recognition protein family domain-containing protein n=1 Tax=Leptosia nina TaxID=320188 RepID=A0AAV1JZQ2_9NEOP